MKISVYNCDSHQRKVVKSAIRKFINHLISDELLIDSLNVRIKFVNALNADGFCEALNFEDEFGAVDYLIEIDADLSESDRFLTLAHEIVHVKQYITGELSVDHRYWRGKRVRELDYYSQPWEMEAHTLEQAVLKSWKTLD
jgi:hypothetical protein